MKLIVRSIEPYFGILILLNNYKFNGVTKIMKLITTMISYNDEYWSVLFTLKINIDPFLRALWSGLSYF